MRVSGNVIAAFLGAHAPFAARPAVTGPGGGGGCRAGVVHGTGRTGGPVHPERAV